MDNRNVKRAAEQLVLVLNGGGQAHLFSKLCSAEHLFATWEKFARGKRGKPDVQRFERKLEENIFELQSDLLRRKYKHGLYQPFIVHDPKRRQIHKAPVRDRLLHQAIVDCIEPYFEKHFIFDSFSCRKNKGTHAGVKRLQKFLRRASANNTKTVYALKCDIRQFFATVDHEILLNLIKAKIKDEELLKIVEKIINSFCISPVRGIPLGNVTSQLFANVYLHELDWFMKHRLRESFYLRYCDDFVIVGEDRQKLLELVKPIKQFLASELSLNIHSDKTTIKSWNQGIDFLGYVLKPDCILLRSKTRQRMLKRVNKTNLYSYLGLCSHANSYRLQRLLELKLWEPDH